MILHDKLENPRILTCSVQGQFSFKGPLTTCFTSGNWHESGSLATIRFWHDVYLIVLMIHAKNDMTCKFRNWPAALESYKTDILNK